LELVVGAVTGSIPERATEVEGESTLAVELGIGNVEALGSQALREGQRGFLDLVVTHRLDVGDGIA